MQRLVEANLDPAGTRGNVLTLILGAPALDEGEANDAHLGELEAMLVAARPRRLLQEARKVVQTEDLQFAAGRNLADGCGVEVVVEIAKARLDEDGHCARMAFGNYFALRVGQCDACQYDLMICFWLEFIFISFSPLPM